MTHPYLYGKYHAVSNGNKRSVPHFDMTSEGLLLRQHWDPRAAAEHPVNSGSQHLPPWSSYQEVLGRLAVRKLTPPYAP